MPNPLTDLARRLSDTLTVVRHLAGIADDISSEMPRRYTAAPESDGVRRDVEAVVIALDERGVTPTLNDAKTSLRRAITHAELAARQIDAAVNRWEGDTDSAPTTTAA